MLDVPFRILPAVSYSRQSFNGVIKIILQTNGIKRHIRNTLIAKQLLFHEKMKQMKCRN